MVTFVLISLDLIERGLVNGGLQTDKDLCGGVFISNWTVVRPV